MSMEYNDNLIIYTLNLPYIVYALCIFTDYSGYVRIMIRDYDVKFRDNSNSACVYAELST